MHDIPDVIDELVTATAPRAAVADADEAFDALVARLMRSPVEQRSRSRLRRAVGVTAVAVVAVAVPAAAMWAPLRTGLFGGAGDTENDRTEFLQSASPEIAEVVRRHVDPAVLPPGVPPDEVVRTVTGHLHRNPALVQEATVRQLVAWNVACRWTSIWLSAVDEDDRRTMAAAVAGIRAASSTFDWVADAAAAVDRPQVGQVFKANCSGLPQR